MNDDCDRVLIIQNVQYQNSGNYSCRSSDLNASTQCNVEVLQHTCSVTQGLPSTANVLEGLKHNFIVKMKNPPNLEEDEVEWRLAGQILSDETPGVLLTSTFDTENMSSVHKLTINSMDFAPDSTQQINFQCRNIQESSILKIFPLPQSPTDVTAKVKNFDIQNQKVNIDIAWSIPKASDVMGYMVEMKGTTSPNWQKVSSGIIKEQTLNLDFDIPKNKPAIKEWPKAPEMSFRVISLNNAGQSKPSEPTKVLKILPPIQLVEIPKEEVIIMPGDTNIALTAEMNRFLDDSESIPYWIINGKEIQGEKIEREIRLKMAVEVLDEITNESYPISLGLVHNDIILSRTFINKHKITFLDRLMDTEIDTAERFLIMPCTTSNPCHVRWQFNSTPIEEGDKYKIQSKGCEHILAVTDLTLDDEGEYSCLITESNEICSNFVFVHQEAINSPASSKRVSFGTGTVHEYETETPNSTPDPTSEESLVSLEELKNMSTPETSEEGDKLELVTAMPVEDFDVSEKEISHKTVEHKYPDCETDLYTEDEVRLQSKLSGQFTSSGFHKPGQKPQLEEVEVPLEDLKAEKGTVTTKVNHEANYSELTYTEVEVTETTIRRHRTQSNTSESKNFTSQAYKMQVQPKLQIQTFDEVTVPLEEQDLADRGEEQAPEISVPVSLQKTINKEEGDSLELIGVITGNPLPEVRWFFNETEIRPDDQRRRM